MSRRERRLRGYRWAQRLLLPEPFRRRFGAAMLDCLAATLARTSGPLDRLGAWCWALSDLLRTAWRLRRDRRLPPGLHPGLRRPPRPHIPLVLRMDQLLQDLRYAIRSLLRTPGVTVVAILTLALGIGANSVIFSLVDGVLLEPLAVERPDRLAALYESNPLQGWNEFSVSPPNYLDWKERLRSFESMTASHGHAATLTGDGDPRRVRALMVAGDYFGTLGLQPQLGRGFTADEHRQGNDRVVVLAESLWRSRFGGDPDVVGDTVRLDQEPHSVVGVFTGPSGLPGTIDLYKPLDMDAEATVSRGAHYYRVIGRLAEGVELETARRELVDLAARLPMAEDGWTAEAEPLHEAIVGDLRPSLLMLLGVVGLVLLIACANVANLSLARSTRRSRELGLRAALGAGGRRIVRLVLTESLVLALAGGGTAVALAVAGVGVLRATLPAGLPRLDQVSVDPGVLLFTLVVATLTGLLFGLAPARRALHVEPAESLETAAPTTAGHPGRLMSALVVVEIALAVVVVAGAGLLLRSMVQLQAVDPGFATSDRLTARVGFPRADYPEPADVGVAWRELLRRVEALPDVSSVGAISVLPMASDFSIGFDIEGRPATRPEDLTSAEMRVVAGDYFEALDIPTVRGRTFTEADRPETATTVVVNEAFVRRFFPDGDPLRGRIDPGWRRPDEGRRWAEIVGVVGDVRAFGLGNEAVPVYYVSAAQSPIHSMTVVAHARGRPQAVVDGLHRALAEVDPEVPLYDVASLTDVVRGSTSRPRFRAALLGSFGLLALVLAAVGIYGLISTMVASRTREIGVRMAIGAGPGSVRRLVVADGLRLAAVGIALGLVIALGVGRLLAGFLHGISPHDPPTLVAVVLFLLVVAVAASALPARRATRLDPVRTLRSE